jgi:hypothetical protein
MVDGDCKRCDSNHTSGFFLLLTLVAFLLIYCLSMWFSEFASGMCIVQVLKRFVKGVRQQSKVILCFFQMVLLLPSAYDVQYPSDFASFLKPLALVNLNFVQIFRFSCFYPDWTHHDTVLCLCICLVGLRLAQFGLCAALRCCSSHNGYMDLRGKLQSAGLTLLYVAYPILCTNLFHMLATCERFDDGRTLLRSDYMIDCSTTKHENMRYFSALMTVVLIIGFPIELFYVLWSDHCTTRTQTGSMHAAPLSFFVNEYKYQFWWWELALLGKRFLITGLAVVIRYGSLLQLVIGTLWAFMFVCLDIALKPCIRPENNFFASFVSLMFFLVMFSCILLKVRLGADIVHSFLVKADSWIDIGFNEEWLVVIMMLSSVLVLLVGSALVAKKMFTATNSPQIRDGHGRKVRLSHLPAEKWHLFLSHTWSTGQDQVAQIMKELKLLLPSAKIWLDVESDEFTIDALEAAVLNSESVLIFLSKGYLARRNTLREAREAILRKKNLIMVREITQIHGGGSMALLAEEFDALNSPTSENCLYADFDSVFLDYPQAADIKHHLVDAASNIILWHRIKCFKVVALKAIVHGMLHATHNTSRPWKLPRSPHTKPSNDSLRRMQSFHVDSSEPNKLSSLVISGELSASSLDLPSSLLAGRQYHLCFFGGDDSSGRIIQQIEKLRQQFPANLAGLRYGICGVNGCSVQNSANCLLWLSTKNLQSAPLMEQVRDALRHSSNLLTVHNKDPSDPDIEEFDRFLECCPKDLSNDLFDKVAIDWFDDARYSAISTTLIIKAFVGSNSTASDSTDESKRKDHRQLRESGKVAPAGTNGSCCATLLSCNKPGNKKAAAGSTTATSDMPRGDGHPRSSHGTSLGDDNEVESYLSSTSGRVSFVGHLPQDRHMSTSTRPKATASLPRPDATVATTPGVYAAEVQRQLELHVKREELIEKLDKLKRMQASEGTSNGNPDVPTADFVADISAIQHDIAACRDELMKELDFDNTNAVDASESGEELEDEAGAEVEDKFHTELEELKRAHVVGAWEIEAALQETNEGQGGMGAELAVLKAFGDQPISAENLDETLSTQASNALIRMQQQPQQQEREEEKELRVAGLLDIEPPVAHSTVASRSTVTLQSGGYSHRPESGTDDTDILEQELRLQARKKELLLLRAQMMSQPQPPPPAMTVGVDV